MFDLFRSRAKIVRYFLGGLLLIVAASMVVTLIPGWGSIDTGQDQVVAQIGKEELTTRDVQQQMQAAQRNRAFPPEMADIFAQELVDEMITTRAMVYEAHRMGLTISDAELVGVLRNFPQLFPNGQFDRQAYEAFANQQGMTVPQFEAALRQQLLVGRLTNLVTQSVIVTPEEVAAEFRRRNEKVKLEYIAIAADNVKNEASVTPDQVKKYFEQNKAQYRIPEKRSFDLLSIDETRAGQKINISDQELRRIYDANKDQYRVPERVHVRHILLKTTDVPKADIPKVQAKAEAILAELKKGANFEELAKKDSQDPGSASKGGDLGWIQRGQTVPQFEAAAFSLKPGQLSGVIKTDYGFHIIQVLQKEEARLKPFEEVKDQIAKEQKQQQVFDLMQKAAEEARNELKKTPQQAQQVAARLNMDFTHVDQWSPGQPVPDFGNNPDFNDAISGVPKNGVTQVMQAPGNKLAVAVVTAIVPERPAELAEVAPQIQQQLLSRRVADLVNQRAVEVMNKSKADGGDLKQVAKQMGLEVKTTQEFGVEGAADGIGSASLMPDAFKQPVDSLFGPITVAGKRFVCKIVEKVPADISKLPAQRAGLLNELKQTKGRQQVQLFMDSVRAALIREGKVKIHQNVLNRMLAAYRT